MVDWNMVIQAVIGVAFAVIGYLYRQLQSRVEKTHEDLLNYKLFVSERFVTNDHLAKAVENLNKSVDNVSSGILRIEHRINNQIDNRSNANGNHS